MESSFGWDLAFECIGYERCFCCIRFGVQIPNVIFDNPPFCTVVFDCQLGRLDSHELFSSISGYVFALRLGHSEDETTDAAKRNKDD